MAQEPPLPPAHSRIVAAREFPVICAEQGIFSFLDAALTRAFNINIHLQWFIEFAIGSPSSEQGNNREIRHASAIRGAARSIQKARPYERAARASETSRVYPMTDPSTQLNHSTPGVPRGLYKANEDVRSQSFLASQLREVIWRNHSRMKSIARVNGNSATVSGDCGGHFIFVV